MRQAVWSCYQETPTAFREYTLSDPGAWPDEPLWSYYVESYSTGS